jgi:hypothetical protein
MWFVCKYYGEKQHEAESATWLTTLEKESWCGWQCAREAVIQGTTKYTRVITKATM